MDYPRPARQLHVYIAIVLINVGLFVVQVLKGVSITSPQLDLIIAWGANVAPFTLLGQPWRLFTSMFLHIGLLHLALNMYMLISLGGLAERSFGKLRFTLVYLISGLFGSLASALWHATHKVSQVVNVGFGQTVTIERLDVAVAAGASGALMGISGAFLAQLLVATARKEQHEAISLRGPLAQTIAINLGMGFMLRGFGIDNACHVGGLVAGALLGAAFALAGPGTRPARRAGATAAIVAVSLGLLYMGLQIKPSAELVALKKQLQGEMDAKNAGKRAADESAASAREAAHDRDNPPASVSDTVAAGAQIALGDWANGVAVSADGKHLYVPGEMDNTLKIVDVASKKVITTIPGVVPGARPGDCRARECKGLGANAVALSPDERFAYVTSMEAGKLTVVDLVQKKALSAIATGAFPMAVAVARSGKRAYIVNVIDRNVAALDLAAGALVGAPAPFSASGSLDWDEQIPQPVVWLANGEREVWVSNENGTGMVVFDAGSMKLVREVDLSDYNRYEASAVNAAGSAAWVLGNNALDLIDIASKRVTQSFPLCHEIMGAEMALSPDGKLLAIAELSMRGRFVRLLKLRTLQTVGIYPAVGRVSGVRFSPDGKQLFVTTNPQTNKRPAEDNFVSIVELAKSAHVATAIAEHGQFLCPRQQD